MALLPPVAVIKPAPAAKPVVKEDIENVPIAEHAPLSDHDDFLLLRKKKQAEPEKLSAMFPGSTLQNCTFNLTFNK